MNERTSLATQNLSENVNLKTATFQEFSPEQSSYKAYSQNFDINKKVESGISTQEEINRLGIFVKDQAINYDHIQVEKASEEKVIFSQDNKVEYWFFVIEGSVRLSYSPLKFPQVSSELQDLIQFFDYSKLRDSPQLSFTFCKSQGQSPLQRSQSQNVQNERDQKDGAQKIYEKEKEEGELYEQIERSNKSNNTSLIKKSDTKSKTDLTIKTSFSLPLKTFEAGDIITFKELKYYSATGTSSKGSTVLKIGISQVSNLKVCTLWQNYSKQIQYEQQTLQQSQQHQYDYNENTLNLNSTFDETFNESISKYKFIQSIPLFQQLSSDIIDQSFNLINYKQGDIVFKEQELAQDFYIILEGEVELLKLSNPTNYQSISRSPSISPKKNYSSTNKLSTFIKASVLSHGSIFGEEEVVMQSVRNFTARASSKRLVVYQLSIFFFLDYICRQNEIFYEKLKQMLQNKLAWRNNQIDSIQKVQKKLNQIENSNKSNSNLLKNTQVNDLTHVASDQSILMKIPHKLNDQSAQNSPQRQQKRASSHLRMETSPLKNHPKMAANPFLLPQISQISESQQINVEITRNQLKNNSNYQGIQPQKINTHRKNNSSQSNYQDMKKTIKSCIDSEENTIQKNVKRKQKIINMFKKNNQILSNNKFPSFEKPLIPVDGYGLAVKSKNKFLLSSSKQHSRNPSQPSIDYGNSLENSFCDQAINSRIKNKLIQNTSNMNISLNSQPSNINFDKFLNEIDVDIVKDQNNIQQIVNPIQNQMTQISQNSNQQIIPFINLTTNSNTRVGSRNSLQKLTKEQNKSMDDIYSQIDKITSNQITTDIETTRIHSFRNPYINGSSFQDNSARNSVNDLSPSKLGSLIDRNYKIYQKLGTYFRPSKSYLLNKQEKFLKSKKAYNFPSQQDLTISSYQNEQTQGIQQNLKPIYNSLEKYRFLEKSPSKDNSKRKSLEYNQQIRDKIENYINDQLGTINKKYKLVKDQNQDLDINQEMISLGVLNKNSPKNNQETFKRDIANKLLSHNPSVANSPTNINKQAQQEEILKPKSARCKQSSSLQKHKRQLNNSYNYQAGSCLQNSACECRYCIPHYKQNSSKSELRYQLQEGGCSMQYTNKKNLIIKKTTQLVNINYPQIDQFCHK